MGWLAKLLGREETKAPIFQVQEAEIFDQSRWHGAGSARDALGIPTPETLAQAIDAVKKLSAANRLKIYKVVDGEGNQVYPEVSSKPA